MEAKACLTNVRISPRKVSVVLDLIRGKDAANAMAILKYTPKAAFGQGRFESLLAVDIRIVFVLTYHAQVYNLKFFSGFSSLFTCLLILS